MKVSGSEKALNYVILAMFAMFAFFPIGTILVTSLGPQLGVATSGLHWNNLIDAWNQGEFGPALLRSLVVAAIAMPVALICSVLTGYAFGTMCFLGSKPLFYIFVFGMMVPSEAIVIPLFYNFRDAGMTDTIWAIALPQIAQSIAFGTFWMRSQFAAMPKNLVEAAAIDGTSGFGTLWRVLIPPLVPSLATLGVLLFMWTWNEFLIPLVMSPGAKWRTAPLGLSVFQGQYTADGALMAAAGLIIATPIIVVFLVLQRYFIAGVLEGAAKE